MFVAKARTERQRTISDVTTHKTIAMIVHRVTWSTHVLTTIADADSADFASSGNGVAGERHWGPGISLATAGANRKGSCVLPNYRRVWGLVGG